MVLDIAVHSIGPLKVLENNHGSRIPANETNVFGWFRFCRRLALRLTVREKSIHRKLAKSLAVQNGVPGHVVTVLMQERWSENHATYLWKFAAFLQKDRWFIPCRVEIVNLKASTCGSYKPYPSIHQQQRLPQVTKALSCLNSSFSSACGNTSFDMVQTVRNTGQEIVKSLNETITKFRVTESELELAYEEHENLKRMLDDLQAMLNKKQVSNERDAVCQKKSSVQDSSATSDSSDSGEYYGDEKAEELIKQLKSDSFEVQSSSQDSHNQENDLGLKSSQLNAVQKTNFLDSAPELNDDPPPPYDPFDSLVDIAKADLQKGDNAAEKNDINVESNLLAQYNDERPWSDRTRAGRSRNQS